MEEVLEKLAYCIERGKIDRNSSYPKDLAGQDGASELTLTALSLSFTPNEILKKSLMAGMNNIGEKFGQGKAFIPELLISAKAMNASMAHLKKYFESGEAQYKGTFIIGTAAGDLHDIGKNIVKMVLEGDGWKVIDLGVDVKAEKFISALAENPDGFVGMSALLTTTMMNMENSVKEIKNAYPDVKIFVGGAPLSKEFSDKIGAENYFPDPHELTKYLAKAI